MGRDWTKPLSETDMEELICVFKSMPTYNEGGWVTSNDVLALCHGMEYHRTSEELALYKAYWDKAFDGIISIDNYKKVIEATHNSAKWTKTLAEGCDKDGNGFISQEEFGHLMKMVVVNERKVEPIPWEEFLAEADTDHDGRVSIVECTNWLDNHLNG